jgi:branched-chain amino acid transport system ATP-binding protein
MGSAGRLNRERSSESAMSSPHGSNSLRARSIRVVFGALRAVDGVDFDVACGEIVGLIGPNGAGKTTLVNVLTGYQPPTRGAVCLGDQPITALAPDRRARLGVVRTFQSARLFESMTLRENLEAAAVGSGQSLRDSRTSVETILDQLPLGRYADTEAGALPHGIERLATVGRALAARPRFLLLDEPAAGLDEQESDGLLDDLRHVQRSFELGLVVIDHDMRLVMRLCDRLHVLVHGATLAVGTVSEIRANPAVLTAYLGVEA